MWAIFGILLMFLVTWLVTKGYLVFAGRAGWLDRPNLRSSHTVATPRGGGVGFVLTGGLWILMAVMFGWISGRQFGVLLPGWLGLGLLGFVDDRQSLPATVRFLVQIVLVGASIFALGGLPDIMTRGFSLHLGWFGSVVALFFGLWSVNLFNFMDGTDGIAGVEAISVLGMGGLILWFAGAHGLAITSIGISAAIAAFLTFNWAPARLFMGDVGSCPLGFLIFALTIISAKFVGISPVIWFILYGVFLFDASVTLIRRILHGQKWYQAHKSHAYQRLHQAGWSHRRVAIAVLIVNAILSILAWIAWREPLWQMSCLFVAYAMLTWVYLWVEKKSPFTSKDHHVTTSQA